MSKELNNKIALEGVDRCDCGCKYWENDRCVDCTATIGYSLTTQINEKIEEVVDLKWEVNHCMGGTGAVDDARAELRALRARKQKFNRSLVTA